MHHNHLTDHDLAFTGAAAAAANYDYAWRRPAFVGDGLERFVRKRSAKSAA